MTTVHRTCPLCEAVCGLTLTLDDGGHVTGVRGDKDDPFSKGFICPKGASLGHLDEDPDRLSKPLVREGDQWREVSWDEAFATVARALEGVRDRQTIAVYLGNPGAHTMAGALYTAPLIRALGTRNVFSASTADQMPKHVASGLMFGHPLHIPVPDLDRTDYLLMLGANPLESNGSLCTAPDFPGRLKAIRRRGGKVVVVDPRRTRTAAQADEHVFVRPGSDAYLLFGLVHTLFAEQLTSVSVEVNGLEEVREAAKHFPPEVVARRTGVPEETIVRLARELAAAPTAAVYARIGTCTQEFGTLAQWLVDVLNTLTGNLDRPGGAMFPMPATEPPRSRRPVHDRQVEEPRARSARGQRRAARGDAGRRDRDAGRGAGALPGDGGGQPRAVGAERVQAGRGVRAARLHGQRRSLPQRDDQARERDPAAAEGAAVGPLRLRAAGLRGAQLHALLASRPASRRAAVGVRDHGAARDDRLGARRRSGRVHHRPDAPEGRSGAPAHRRDGGRAQARHDVEARAVRAVAGEAA
ncbi:molybdopterin-dependent oxidoreductase [Nonomuraea dietziae]|uniref:molybdopterin-dependent oxidoreductase n=1 Tax=Nonomuraea dietziae TaxID=65515 RepID=UPI0031DF9082